MKKSPKTSSVNELTALNKGNEILKDLEEEVSSVLQELSALALLGERAKMEYDKITDQDHFNYQKANYIMETAYKASLDIFSLKNESMLEEKLNGVSMNNASNVSSEDNKDPFAEIYGLDKIKSELKKALDPERYKKGVNFMLYGEPGCGKSMLMRAVLQYAKQKGFGSFYLRKSDSAKRCVGEVEEVIKKTFIDDAGKYKTSIICIDEIDSLAKRRTACSQEHHPERLSALLEAIEGIETRDNKIILVTATNIEDIDYLDPAFIDRIDHILKVPLPGKEDRAIYFAEKLEQYEGKLQSINLDFDIYLAVTDGWSYRQINKMLDYVFTEASNNKDKKITEDLFINYSKVRGELDSIEKFEKKKIIPGIEVA